MTSIMEQLAELRHQIKQRDKRIAKLEGLLRVIVEIDRTTQYAEVARTLTMPAAHARALLDPATLDTDIIDKLHVLLSNAGAIQETV
jgi:hypothetical protein